MKDYKNKDHTDHEISAASTSWGDKIVCDTCQVIVRCFSEGKDIGYIPSGVKYIPIWTPQKLEERL
jgi:hypothetical protein